MAQDTYNRYTGDGRPYHELGHTTPEVELSESVRPFVPLLPAPYIPMTRFDDHKRANIVLSVGTPVALDDAGNLLPGGIPGGHTFEYTALDYTTDLPATRNPATGAAITSAVTEAIMASGLTGDVAGEFLRPIGVTSYNVYAHEGGGTYTSFPTYSLNHTNPVDYDRHNTMAQDLVAVTCDYVLLVPYISGRNILSDEVKIFDNSANGVATLTYKAKSFVFAHEELTISNQATLFHSGLTLKYVSPNCGLSDTGGGNSALLPGGIAAGTLAALQFVAPGDTLGTAVDCSTAGNHIVYSADTAKYIVVNTDPTAAQQGPGPGGPIATSGNFTMALTSAIIPGDYVKARVGKFVKWSKTQDDDDEIVGQVLRVDTNVVGKSLMDRVKTAYERASVPSRMMPGWATRGVPYSVHLVTDGAWRQYTTSKDLAGTVLTAAGLTRPSLNLITINLLK